MPPFRPTLSEYFHRVTKLFGLPLLATCIGLGSAIAAPRDEVRVYTDSIEEPGEWGIELHFNSIPRSRLKTISLGDPKPISGLIVTPEISYGLSKNLELEFGFLLPSVKLDDGSSLRIAPHVRAKWLPKLADPKPGKGLQGGDWFWGSIFEWSASPYRKSTTLPNDDDAASYFAIRPLIGWRNSQWLFAGNIIFEWPIKPRDLASRPARPEVAPAIKVLRYLNDRYATGVEYHGELGPLRRFAPSGEQQHTLYWMFENKKPFWMSIGIGHGLNRASGGWTIKGSIEISLD